MRLWSLENYKCIEEYPMPDSSSLVDFDFDESKVNNYNKNVYFDFRWSYLYLYLCVCVCCIYYIDCRIAWEPNRNMEAKRGKKRISVPRGYFPQGLMYAVRKVICVIALHRGY